LDLTCAAVGLGILEQGAAALVSGSFENLLIPTASSPTPSLLLRGLSVTPHPGPSGYAVLALSPTGTMVLNWVRRLLDVSIEELDARLASADPAPSPVMAIPYLSGSMLYWDQGRKARGGVLGLTLATSDLDVIRAFMESITYDHVNTFSVLRETGLEVRRIVAAGGGSRSAWWTQLKADMLNASIEASCLPEPGTVGAAMLAGVAVGTYSSVDEAICAFSQAGGTLIPDPERASLHRARLDAYREIVPLLISTIYHDT
jgi:xylulokinase